MQTFFIADTHFGDQRILRYENRPFPSVEAMDAEMILRWNQVVSAEDRVYVLGDFGGNGREETLLSQLNGTKYLIKGNHDTLPNEAYRAAGFAEVYDLPVLLDQFWILSHDPLYVCENMPYANLFGHIHASPLFKDYSSQHVCVCVERTDYAPISFDALKKMIQEAAQHE